MLVHWIWLAHRPELTEWEKVQLLQHFQDPENIYFADAGAFSHLGLKKEAIAALQDKNLSACEEILVNCQKEKLHILTFQDAAYPVRLKNIPDPPLVLYYKGQLPDFDGSPVIGVVGTRKASGYGLQTAKRMGYQIGRCGGIVVSGLAFGIDSMAMSGALTAGTTVVGVLGCGADVVYPPSNRGLFQDTIQYGCIISEFAPGTPPYRWNFPRRNRIISGLSCGVLVVEAPEGSGALITADRALEQGRDVFVVPGNIDIPTFVGSNRLIREGATPVSSGWDILSEYEALYPDKIRKDTKPSHQTAYPDEVKKVASEAEKATSKVAQTLRVPEKKEKLKKDFAKKVIDKEPVAPYIDLNDTLPKLSSDEAAIVNALRQGERLVDDVIAETGLTTGKLLSSLTMLELKGILMRLPGKRIRLK